MDNTTKESIVKVKWAETITHIVTLSDEELIQRITICERAHIEAQVVLEATRHEIDRRRHDYKSRMHELLTEEDRKYRPKPQDKIEFDKKAKDDKLKRTKEEKAIETFMNLGFSEEKSREMFAAAKAGKV